MLEIGLPLTPDPSSPQIRRDLDSNGDDQTSEFAGRGENVFIVISPSTKNASLTYVDANARGWRMSVYYYRIVIGELNEHEWNSLRQPFGRLIFADPRPVKNSG